MMIAKKFILFIFLFVVFTKLQAQTVTQTDAELAAQNFMQNTVTATGAKFGLKSILKTITNFIEDHPVSFTVLFDGGGFVTLSATVNVDSIMSYSPIGQFWDTNMPSEYAWWISDYHNTINYIINNAIQDLTAQSKWADLLEGGGGTGNADRLMSSTWGQSGCERTLAGSVSLTYNKLVNDGGLGTGCNICNVSNKKNDAI